MKKSHILSLSLLPISLLLVSCEQDSPTGISVPSPSFAKVINDDHFDMNDRFSGSGANGDGHAKVKGDEMDLTINARDLIANHPYEVHVIVGPEGREELVDDLADLIGVHIFPVTSDKKGKFKFKLKDFDLDLDPGQYRLDYLVLHDLAAHDHDQDTFPFFLVLACEPASFFTITKKSGKSGKKGKSEKSGKSERQSASVMDILDGGALIKGAKATLKRKGDDFEVKLKTKGLTPGNAYTLWAFRGTPPSAPMLVDALVVGGSGKATFAGHIMSSDAITQLILRDHHAKIPGTDIQLTGGPNGGCTVMMECVSVQKAVF